LVPSSRAPGALPSALTEERNIEGFTRPVWVSRELNPGEGIAVQQALVAIEARLAPASSDTIIQEIAHLMVHDHTKRSAEEVDVILSDYAQDLAEFSEAHVREAAREHRRTKNWFPKIAELRALALDLHIADRVMRHRARVLLGLEEPASWEKPRPAPVAIDGGLSERGLSEMEDRLAKLAKVNPGLAQSIRNLYTLRQRGRAPAPLLERAS